MHYRILLIGMMICVATSTVPVYAQQSTLPLSLAEAQQRAVEGNWMLQAAEAEVTHARAAKLQTWAGHLPSLSLSEGVTRSSDAVNAFSFRLKQERFTQADFAVSSLNFPRALTNYQTILSVGQPIFNGGQSLYTRRQAAAGVRASEADLTQGTNEVRFRTAEAYWGTVLAAEMLKTVQQALETARNHLAVTEAHYRQEMIPLSDLLAAQVRVTELRSEEIAAENRIADAVDGLSLVMGLSTDIRITPTDTLAYRQIEQPVAELITTAAGNRPDVTAAAHREQAARYGVGAARAAYLPHVNAFFQLELDSDRLFKQRGESWTAGAMVTWNLFSGFKSIGGVQAARARAAGASAQMSFLRARVEREIRQAYRGVMAAQAQVDVANEAVQQADERLRISELMHREGQITTVDLLAAATAQQQTRLRRVQSLHALNMGLARLEFVAGQPIR